MARAGFSFLICPDSALLKEELERQASSWFTARRILFWGDEEPNKAFWDNLQQSGLFAEKRIIIVRQAEMWPAGIWKNLSQALARHIEHVWPFFCLEVGCEKGNFKIPAHIKNSACFKHADRNSWIWRSEGLGPNLEEYVKTHAVNRKLELTGDILSRFCLTVPHDANSIVNELDKLALLAPDGKVGMDLLPAGEIALESDAFELIRCLVTGNISPIWKEVAKDTEGNLLFFVIALLARECRLLWQILAGENPRLFGPDAPAKRKLAKKLGFPGVATAFATIADSEWRVKTGKLSPHQALEYLCSTITQLYTGEETLVPKK